MVRWPAPWSESSPPTPPRHAVQTKSQKHVEARFKTFDANHDGELDAAEIHKMENEAIEESVHDETSQAADILARADKNGDGVRHAAPAAALSCCLGANRASQGERPLA